VFLRCGELVEIQAARSRSALPLHRSFQAPPIPSS
jgi:hypothetical protein